jgi:hypothetical protein
MRRPALRGGSTPFSAPCEISAKKLEWGVFGGRAVLIGPDGGIGGRCGLGSAVDGRGPDRFAMGTASSAASRTFACGGSQVEGDQGQIEVERVGAPVAHPVEPVSDFENGEGALDPAANASDQLVAQRLASAEAPSGTCNGGAGSDP